MAKVWLSSDLGELVFYVQEGHGILVDVPDDLLRRWDEAYQAYSALEKEVYSLYEKARR